MSSNVYNLSSTAGTHYTTAIAAETVEKEDFPGLSGDGNGKIIGIAIKSKENLAWQVELYDKNDVMIAKYSFQTTDAETDATD